MTSVELARPPTLDIDPPRRRASVTISNRANAPMVALIIVEKTVGLRCTPCLRSNTLPSKAPAIPIRTLPTIPNPVPRPIFPANQPATRPTTNMIREPSLDMCMFVSSRNVCLSEKEKDDPPNPRSAKLKGGGAEVSLRTPDWKAVDLIYALVGLIASKSGHPAHRGRYGDLPEAVRWHLVASSWRWFRCAQPILRAVAGRQNCLTARATAEAIVCRWDSLASSSSSSRLTITPASTSTDGMRVSFRTTSLSRQ
jgi:hypothetical protein